VPDSPRAALNFNPGWRFLKADAAGAEKPGFDDSAWEAANLPHSLEILGENASGCRNYQGPAWYRKRFQAAATGGKIFLYFEVEGPARIIAGPQAHANPVKTEFGTATALGRATTVPGAIRVKAHVPWLKSGEVRLVSAPAPLPLAFDAKYAAASRPPAGGAGLTIGGGREQPADVKQLQEEVLRLKRELTSKEQEVMELRSKTNGALPAPEKPR
jgi:hypothetical protein